MAATVAGWMLLGFMFGIGACVTAAIVGAIWIEHHPAGDDDWPAGPSSDLTFLDEDPDQDPPS